MFNSKKQAAPTMPKNTSVSAAKSIKAGGNQFLSGATKKSAETLSGNGALKYSITNNELVDQFSFLGSYMAPRSFNDVSKDCEKLWAYNPEIALKFMFYLRMITRDIKHNGHIVKSQKGGELKHEFAMRYLWLYFKDRDSFIRNLRYVPAVGSWKDIFNFLYLDFQYNGWEDRKLDWDLITNFILHGMKDPDQVELIKKYMPSIVASSKAKTIEKQSKNAVAKFLSSKMFGSKDYVSYRKLKSSGKGHVWQQQISKKEMESIDFGKIPGRALSKLVRSKFLKNQNLTEKYTKWVSKPETKTVKYTGFILELFANLPSSLVAMPKHVQDTINKQFAELIRKGGEKQATKFIVVRDTSGSMAANATGTDTSCFNVAKGLALYFSEFLTGTFEDHWIEFNSDAKLHKWTGNTPLEKWYNDSSRFVGSTNFQSVINLFCRMKAQGVPEEDFPTGILCISDAEFNPTSLNKTNREAALDSLRRAGFSQSYIDNFVIVLWNLQSNAYGKNTGKKFESNAETPNCFYMSGYNGATIAFLTDNIKTPIELAMNALDQEILQNIKLVEKIK